MHIISLDGLLDGYYYGFTGGSDDKESAYNARDPDSIPGLGRLLEGLLELNHHLSSHLPWAIGFVFGRLKQ